MWENVTRINSMEKTLLEVNHEKLDFSALSPLVQFSSENHFNMD